MLVTIDAAVLEKVKALKHPQYQLCKGIFAEKVPDETRIKQGWNRAIDAVITILSTAQSQPGVGDDARKEALEALEKIRQFIGGIMAVRGYGGEALDATETIRASLSAGPVQEWQTMESAPRDGTRILVYSKAGYLNVVQWDGESWLNQMKGHWGDGALAFWHPIPPLPRTVTDKI